MGFDFYSWVMIPLFIMGARICDVTLGTLRFIFISRGYRKLAPIIGFFEVIIWLVAIQTVLVNLKNFACFLGYGFGFAAGNFIGMWLEEKLSIGMVLVRIVLRQDQNSIADFLKQNDYGFTIIEGEGTKEKVKILFTIIKRKNLDNVLAALFLYAPKAFYSVENIQSARQGIYPLRKKLPDRRRFSIRLKSNREVQTEV